MFEIRIEEMEDKRKMKKYPNFYSGLIIGFIAGLVYATCSLHFIHHLF